MAKDPKDPGTTEMFPGEPEKKKPGPSEPANQAEFAVQISALQAAWDKMTEVMDEAAHPNMFSWFVATQIVSGLVLAGNDIEQVATYIARIYQRVSTELEEDDSGSHTTH